MKISFIILTFNSQKYLNEVLTSCSFADEVLIIDSGSSDETLNIAQNFKNVKIIKQNWLGFGKMKRFGVLQAKNDWVFCLDSDEVLTKELQIELNLTLQKPKFKVYKVARLNYFFGKAIRKLGLYPDYSIRFFNKNYANYNEKEVHESVQSKEEIGKLKHHFIHFAYENIEDFIIKQNRYSSLGAKNNLFKAIFSPYFTFFKLYILKGGFLEGKNGFIIAKLYSQYTFWKYIK